MIRLNHLFKDKVATISLSILTLTMLAGLLAPWVAPHDPEEVHMELRFASASWEYLLGNDHLGRCILSRLIYGIRPSVLWVLFALAVTILFGGVAGFIAGYFRGK